MMTKEEIKGKVISTLSEVMNHELAPDLKLSTNLYLELQLDSMDITSLAILLEEDHNIRVKEDQFKSIATLEQLVQFLYDNQQ